MPASSRYPRLKGCLYSLFGGVSIDKAHLVSVCELEAAKKNLVDVALGEVTDSISLHSEAKWFE